MREGLRRENIMGEHRGRNMGEHRGRNMHGRENVEKRLRGEKMKRATTAVCETKKPIPDIAIRKAEILRKLRNEDPKSRDGQRQRNTITKTDLRAAYENRRTTHRRISEDARK